MKKNTSKTEELESLTKCQNNNREALILACCGLLKLFFNVPVEASFDLVFTKPPYRLI